MGGSSSAGRERLQQARRSVTFAFSVREARPTACLVLLWGLAVTLGSGQVVIRAAASLRSAR